MRRYTYMMLLKRPGYFILVMSLLFSLLYLTSCDFEHIGPEGYGKPQKLSGVSGTKIWEVEYYTIDNQRVFPEQCQEDDEFIFFSDGRYLRDYRYTKCSYDQPSEEYGNWVFVNSQEEIEVTINGNRFRYGIEYLSDERMELSLYSLGVNATTTYISR